MSNYDMEPSSPPAASMLCVIKHAAICVLLVFGAAILLMWLVAA